MRQTIVNVGLELRMLFYVLLISVDKKRDGTLVSASLFPRQPDYWRFVADRNIDYVL